MRMKEIETNSFEREPAAAPETDTIRVVSWNINRGLHLDKIITFLVGAAADLVLLQEADVHARRTDYRDISREIAEALHMNYVFGREFEELSQGNHDAPAYHGQVTLSRFAIRQPHILRFSRQSTFWRPRLLVPALPCLQRRRGARMALISEIVIHKKRLLVYNVHLESRGNDALRISQLSEVLTDCCRYAPETSILIAGDFNFDISKAPAALLRLGRFTNVTAGLTVRATVEHCRPWKDPSIDWMLTNTSFTATEVAIHRLGSASDHYPLSANFLVKK